MTKEQEVGGHFQGPLHCAEPGFSGAWPWPWLVARGRQRARALRGLGECVLESCIWFIKTTKDVCFKF